MQKFETPSVILATVAVTRTEEKKKKKIYQK
jgi:hypothetical protein